jgi:LAO/AO transport system kinase
VLSLAQSRLHSHPDLDDLARAVAEGRCDPYSAAASLIAASEIGYR